MYANKANDTSCKKVEKTIGKPKYSNKVLVICPSAPKIAQYIKALGGTLNTKQILLPGWLQKTYHRVNSVKTSYYPPRTILKDLTQRQYLNKHQR